MVSGYVQDPAFPFIDDPTTFPSEALLSSDVLFIVPVPRCPHGTPA